MAEIYRPRSQADAGYLCDLLAQHGIDARFTSGAIVVGDADEARARALVGDAVGGDDDGRDDLEPSWFGRWWRRLRLTPCFVVLLCRALFAMVFAGVRINPLGAAVIAALALIVVLGLARGWPRR